MSVKRRCPECNQWLINDVDCLCGWIKSKSTEKTLTDYRCQCQVRERRCLLPGTNSSSLYGSGKWYCCEHLRNLDDPLLCEAILIDAEKNYENIIQERIDWRQKLFSEDFRIVKSISQKGK